LRLATEDPAGISALCDFAARANPKRGFLIVSRVLGRHLPAEPSAMRASMDRLGALLPADLAAPILFLGMAETATALGQGVFAAYRRLHPATPAVYLQSSRQRVPGAEIVATFEEGHSHAMTHLIQVIGDEISDLVHAARTIVIVDDEASTGNTFVGAIAALKGRLPNLERAETCCITDWSDRGYCDRAVLPTSAHAILTGRMDWARNGSHEAPALARGSNQPGQAPPRGMRSRTGLLNPERAHHASVDVTPGERILVLGEGEHSYEALLIAEEIEAAGGIAAVQCITRSPVLAGHAMNSVSHFADSYNSGAPCFLYNILAHHPDRIVIAAEVDGSQTQDAAKALTELGADVPVVRLLCIYGDR
jgi:hypothetical protein